MDTHEPGDKPAARHRARPRKTVPSYEDLGRVERARKEAGSGQPRRRGATVLGAVVAVSLILALGLALFFHYHSDLAAVGPWTPARYAVIFVIDGVGPEALHMTRTPHIAALERQGVAYDNAWVGQAQVAPPTSNATLGTGVYPWAHGVVGLQWRDPGKRQVDLAAEPDQVHVGSLDRVMESRGVPSFASLLKTHDPSARVLSVGGAGCVASSAAGTWTADYILCPARSRGKWVLSSVVGHGLPPQLPNGAGKPIPVAHGPGLGPTVEGWDLGRQDRWIADQAIAAMRSVRPRLTVINFPEPAVVARWAPASSRASLLRRVMAQIDQDIGAVVAETQRDRTFGRAVFAITSDGAVSTVSGSVPRGALDEAILAAGGETVYLEGDGAAMIGLRDALQAQPVAQVLQGQQLQRVDAVYYKTQTGSSWSYVEQYRSPRLPASLTPALSYLLWTMASAQAPDVAVVYAPHTGTGVARLGGFRRTGAGLGLGWDQQHIPLIVAGHDVFPGKSSAYPARLVDLAPTLETLMGLTPARQNGVPLADAMIQPPAGARGRQNTTARWLTPLVRALKRWALLSGS